MADLDDTIEKLVAVAKRKGYIDAECTVASLKAEAAKSKDKEVQDDAVSLMTAMKKNLDAQTTAVRSRTAQRSHSLTLVTTTGQSCCDQLQRCTTTNS